MKVPYRWITELVDCHGQELPELAKTLTLLGLEAEIGEGLPCAFTGVIAAEVRAAAPHEKGMLLTLSDGQEDYTVYSTAPGIAPGQVVAFAPPGAIVGGQTIEVTPFGEITSEGMVCSAQELGIGRESRDLLELPGIAPGTDLATLLFNDTPIALEYPSNRGDVLSLLGVGRELAAHFRTAPPEFALSPGRVEWGTTSGTVQGEGLRISLHDLDLCPRYAARVLVNVRVDDSPPEVLARLLSLGLKPINNIVDITNLVLMELGQPLHPFDADTLRGAHVIVRRAERGEKLTTLDGIERALTASDCVIADEGGAIALAGIMGGKSSEVHWDTTRVLLESARFDRVAIRRTARRQALRTDASLHFERGIDPALVEQALDRVAWYVERYQCGEVRPMTLSAGVPNPPLRTFAADIDRIPGILGAAITRAEVIAICERLGIEVAERPSEHELITVPSWRADLALPEDLAEEVARHFGYNNIPITLPKAPMKTEVRPPELVLRQALKHDLAAMGCREVMTFPLGGERLTAFPNPLHPGAEPIVLANALSQEQSVMALSLVPGMLDALRQNVRNRQTLPRAFEINKVYWREGETPFEAEELVLCVAQERGPQAEETAFRALKGTIEALFDLHRITASFLADDLPCPPYAAGMAAHWNLDAGPEFHAPHAGIGGVLDPTIADAWDLPLAIALVQLPWPAVVAAAARGRGAIRFQPLARFPAVARDLALVVPEGVRYGELAATIQAHGGPYLSEVALFDVFRGKQVPKAHKSLAFALQFRNPEATLTDDEVNAAMTAILSAATAAHGAALR